MRNSPSIVNWRPKHRARMRQPGSRSIGFCFPRSPAVPKSKGRSRRGEKRNLEELKVLHRSFVVSRNLAIAIAGRLHHPSLPCG